MSGSTQRHQTLSTQTADRLAVRMCWQAATETAASAAENPSESAAVALPASREWGAPAREGGPQSSALPSAHTASPAWHATRVVRCTPRAPRRAERCAASRALRPDPPGPQHLCRPAAAPLARARMPAVSGADALKLPSAGAALRDPSRATQAPALRGAQGARRSRREAHLEDWTAPPPPVRSRRENLRRTGSLRRAARRCAAPTCAATRRRGARLCAAEAGEGASHARVWSTLGRAVRAVLRTALCAWPDAGRAWRTGGGRALRCARCTGSAVPKIGTKSYGPAQSFDGSKAHV